MQSAGNGVCVSDEPNVDVQSTDIELTKPVESDKSSAKAHTESLSDWFVLLCVLLSNVTNGINYSSYSILYLPLTELFGASRAAVGWIQGFELALGSFLGIFFSPAVSRFGCRLPATVGSCLIAAGAILSCLSPNMAWMYLFRGIVLGVGQSAVLLTYSVVIQQRFSKHRSFATGISIIGFSIGNFSGAPLTEFLLNTYGLRGTLALLGAIQAHRIPLSLQFRSPRQFKAASNPTQVSADGDLTLCNNLKHYIKGSLDFSLLKQKTFLLFSITGMIQKFIVHSYVAHTVNWAIAAGLSRQLAIWTLPALSCASITCRIFVSSIADLACVNRLVIYCVGMFFVFLTCLPPLSISGVVGTFTSVVLFGLYAGCTHTLISVVLVDLQGVHQIARCFALYSFLTTFSQLTGTAFMGLLYDVTGSYTAGFMMLAAVALVGCVLMIAVYLLDRRTRKPAKRTSSADVEMES